MKGVRTEFRDLDDVMIRTEKLMIFNVSWKYPVPIILNVRSYWRDDLCEDLLPFSHNDQIEFKCLVLKFHDSKCLYTSYRLPDICLL